MSYTWNIGRRLGALTALMLMILVASSGFGIHGLGRMHEGFRGVAQDTTEALSELAGTVDTLQRLRYRIFTASLESDPAKVAALKAEFSQQDAEFRKYWKSYSETTMTGEEAALAKEAAAGISSYQGYLSTVWDRIAAGDSAGARSEMLGNGVEQFRRAATPLRKLLDYQRREAASSFAVGEENYASDRAIGIGLVVLGVVVGAALSTFIARSVSVPIRRIIKVMERLTAGDTDVVVDVAERQDEVGEMGKSVVIFKDNLIRIKRLEAEQEAQKRKAEQDQRAAMRQMADGFEGSVGKVVQTVTSAATELQTAAGHLASSAALASTQAGTVAASAQQASANVQTVASATEELAASINEIAAQMSRSQSVATRAGTEAGVTTRLVQDLSESVSKIGEVVNLINDIASQTNLLALNATIEAARAGDAGKGFAVVANEVKGLANQTAKATGEIASQITEVQQKTAEAVIAIGSISEVIRQMTEISGSIAAAVQQQTAATDEIARNVEQASAGTQDVSTNIAAVNQAAKDSGQAAGQIRESSLGLSKQAEYLNQEVSRFLHQVRAG